MIRTFDLSRHLWPVHGRIDDYAVCASALLAAQRLLGRHAHTANPMAALATLGDMLEPPGEHHGLSLAKTWLLNLPEERLDAELLQQMSRTVSTEIDPNHHPSCLSAASDVLDAALSDLGQGSRYWRVLAPTIITGSPIDKGERAACAFPPAGHLALRLAASNPVTFFAGNDVLAMTTALLAVATDVDLRVDRRDPLSRSSVGTRRKHELLWELGEFDHLFSIPPLGRRYDLGDGSGPRRADALQFTELDELWSKSLMTVVMDGFLHRSSSGERQVREKLVRGANLIVTSLPACLWEGAPGLQTSLIIAAKEESETVRFYDGRTLLTAKGRPTVQQIADHISDLPDTLGNDASRMTTVPVGDLARTGFNLTVDRYLHQASTKAPDAGSGPLLVSLDTAAEIIRPQAAKPTKNTADGDSVFEVLEITTADIQDGMVLRPSRQIFFADKDRERVAKSTVQPRDIIISIKGSIGLVGLMPDSLPGDIPWTISQSFAIVRARAEPGLALPVILAALLTAPSARKRLQTLAGGTTVPMLLMSDLRRFEIPILLPQVEAVAVDGMRSIEMLQTRVNTLRQSIRRTQQEMWASLWNCQNA